MENALNLEERSVKILNIKLQLYDIVQLVV